MAELHAGLFHRGEGGRGRAEPGDHHGRRLPRHPVVLPRAGVAVAACPDVHAVAVALVVREAALVAFARERRARAPGIDAHAVLGVVHEFALVAIVPGPGFHAAPVLPALVEFACIGSAPRRPPVALGLSVLAGALVRTLQLGIEHEAFCRALGEGGKREKRYEESQCCPPVKGGKDHCVSHFTVTPFSPTLTFGPLSSGLRRCSQKKSPIANPISEPATVSESQCSREATLPAGVTAAHITVTWLDGNEASGRLNESKFEGPRSSSGRARPTAYLRPALASKPVAPAWIAAMPVLLKRLSCSESAAIAAPPIATNGNRLARDTAVSLAREP